MFGVENYFGFLLAGILLNLTPGADTMYILTRSIAQGKKAGIYSVLGIATGIFVHTLFASFGLSVLLAQSAIAFTIVKYLGVGYLVYLGIKMLIEKNDIFENETQKVQQTDLRKIYFQGMMTNVLNPKVVLFFLSFLPQFINPAAAKGVTPFIILGATFITTGTIWCLILTYASSAISNTLRNNKKTAKLMQKISGLVFVGMGLKILVNDK